MSVDERSPTIQMSGLNELWFQVAGTLCNLTCEHCFISCSPKNNTFGFMSLQQIKSRLEESVPLGVQEFYFTGGEPFMNPEMVDILIETLNYGPATVLTNATIFKNEWLERLRQAAEESEYALEFRVSLDGFSPETNDPIRGVGTFDRAVRGMRQLVDHGFRPIITAARSWSCCEEQQVVAHFEERMTQAGYANPRLKILPMLKMGAEESRTCGYGEQDRVTAEMLEGYDVTQLVCEHSRIVTDRGVHVCPILVDSGDSLMGDSLAETLTDIELNHGACQTCLQFGAICSNS